MIHLGTRILWRVSLSVLIVFLGGVSTLAAQVASATGEIGELPGEVGHETWTYAEEEEATEATSHFVRSAATAFVQLDNTNTWVYGGSGCIFRTGGSISFDIDLQIPGGVVLDYLRIFFNDTDPVNDARAFLYAFDGAGNVTLLATAASSGTPGFSSEGSGFFSHNVDNVGEALTMRIDFGSSTTSALEICGVRVRYTTP